MAVPARAQQTEALSTADLRKLPRPNGCSSTVMLTGRSADGLVLHQGKLTPKSDSLWMTLGSCAGDLNGARDAWGGIAELARREAFVEYALSRRGTFPPLVTPDTRHRRRFTRWHRRRHVPPATIRNRCNPVALASAARRLAKKASRHSVARWTCSGRADLIIYLVR